MNGDFSSNHQDQILERLETNGKKDHYNTIASSSLALEAHY